MRSLFDYVHFEFYFGTGRYGKASCLFTTVGVPVRFFLSFDDALFAATSGELEARPPVTRLSGVLLLSSLRCTLLEPTEVHFVRLLIRLFGVHHFGDFLKLNGLQAKKISYRLNMPFMSYAAPLSRLS